MLLAGFIVVRDDVYVRAAQKLTVFLVPLARAHCAGCADQPNERQIVRVLLALDDEDGFTGGNSGKNVRQIVNHRAHTLDAPPISAALTCVRHTLPEVLRLVADDLKDGFSLFIRVGVDPIHNALDRFFRLFRFRKFGRLWRKNLRCSRFRHTLSRFVEQVAHFQPDRRQNILCPAVPLAFDLYATFTRLDEQTGMRVLVRWAEAFIVPTFAVRPALHLEVFKHLFQVHPQPPPQRSYLSFIRFLMAL